MNDARALGKPGDIVVVKVRDALRGQGRNRTLVPRIGPAFGRATDAEAARAFSSLYHHQANTALGPLLQVTQLTQFAQRGFVRGIHDPVSHRYGAQRQRLEKAAQPCRSI